MNLLCHSLALLSSLSSATALPSATVYLTPNPSLNLNPNPNPSSPPPSLTTPELNAFLSHKLAISHYETLPDSLYPTTTKGQMVLGDIHASLPEHSPSPDADQKLVIVIYGSDGKNLLPENFVQQAQQLSLPNPPDSLSFDALVSTYVGRIVHTLKLPLASIHGVREFLQAYHDGIGGGVLDNLEEWAHDWDESAQEWLAWAKEAFKATQGGAVDAQVMPKDEYSRWLNHYGPLDSSAHQLIEDLKTLDAFTERVSLPGGTPPLSLLRLSGLQHVQRRHGEHSFQYRAASEALRSFLAGALAAARVTQTIVLGVPAKPVHTRLGKRTSFSVLTPFQTSEHSFVRRDLIERRRAVFGGSAVPIVTSSRTCYASAHACEQATDTCNGHGKCVEGQKTSGGKCFVCECGKVKDDKGKMIIWAGDMCQKQDISSGFVLLTGSAIGLVVVMAMAIGLLVSIGAEGLPQQLASVSGSSKKMD